MTAAISSALSIASPPLLPALVAARSSACSTDSTVNTPRATGTPVSSAGELAHRHGQLEGAGHAHHGEIVGLAAACQPRGLRPLEQARYDEIVEARGRDRDPSATRAHLALDELGLRHPSSPT